MKKPNLAIYIALFIVVIGLIFQFMDGGVFGENPIPNITKYHKFLFWGGIAIWALGYARQDMLKKHVSDEDQIKPNLKK